MKKQEFLISVIMPVYNVEDYLEEAIDSVVNQTIGFKDNIQLILVDDGSSDNSAAICEKYRDLYPDNIIFFSKENGGVSSARNAGMDYAEGRYINFMDSDDTWSDDAFEIMIRFADKHKDLAIVSGKLVYSGRSADKKYALDYVYRKSRVVKIEKMPDMPLFGLPKLFFAADAIKDMRFDTGLVISEDQLFLMSMLLDQKEFGVAKDAVYYYRKREDNSSAFDGARYNKAYYTVTPERVFREIIKRSIEQYGSVIPYVQNVMMTNLRFRIAPVPEGVLTDEELSAYMDTMRYLLANIEDRWILEQKGMPFWYKVYFLKEKHRESGLDEASRSGLCEKMKLQISELTLGKTVKISGPAHERWISDSEILCAKDERGAEYEFRYIEDPDSDKTGLFNGSDLKGYSHTAELPLRNGAVYSFYLREKNSEDRRLLPAIKNTVLFDSEDEKVLKSGKYELEVRDGAFCISKKRLWGLNI